jgi:tripartite-type tricarboxylate transporter receptor subunit TctC
MTFNNKIISILLASLLSCSAYAKEKVEAMWPFTPASTQGTYFRTILDEANKQQDKYEFIFTNRTGAGGSIATQYIHRQQGTRILAHSAAYFIRPFLYADNPYKFDQFNPLMVMGMSPAALVTKGKTLEQLLQQDKINVGTAGAGSSTHLMAETFFKKYTNKDIKMVHYRDTNESYKDVMAGHIDATFEFLGDAVAKGNTTIIGITGKSNVNNYHLLKDINPSMENLVGIFAIYVPKDVPHTKSQEIQKILLAAEKSDSVQMLYKRDYASKDAHMQIPGDLTSWYNRTIKQFETFTSGIKVE